AAFFFDDGFSRAGPASGTGALVEAFIPLVEAFFPFDLGDLFTISKVQAAPCHPVFSGFGFIIASCSYISAPIRPNWRHVNSPFLFPMDCSQFPKGLARILLLLTNFGKEGTSEEIVPKISQETLAEMVGTTRERVSFFMNKFKKLGLVEYNGGLQVHTSIINAVLHD
ncbi:MAG: winged helix-turn-helix domain-containing protein, partial [Acidobacteria bacterium]|nr:winged helix-turn-helix domain-containing protein [Acidobacteriota bacterium]